MTGPSTTPKIGGWSSWAILPTVARTAWAVLTLVARLVSRGRALLTLGNHDDALLRWLCGEPIDIHRGGLAETIVQIEARPDRKKFKKALATLYLRAPIYLLLDGGALIVAHAGIEEG